MLLPPAEKAGGGEKKKLTSVAGINKNPRLSTPTRSVELLLPKRPEAGVSNHQLHLCIETAIWEFLYPDASSSFLW